MVFLNALTGFALILTIACLHVYFEPTPETPETKPSRRPPSWDLIHPPRDLSEVYGIVKLDELANSTKLVRGLRLGGTLDFNRVDAIHFLGERHSGTNWIFNHLSECFNHTVPMKNKMSRWKHWFQYEESGKVMKNSLVIAQFRDPYDWVSSMFKRPYNVPIHANLSTWREFVNTPWTMPRPKEDAIWEGKEGFVCQNQFRYNEIVPCTDPWPNKSLPYDGLWGGGRQQPPKYELRNDGSGLPYDSLVDLRRDKILNFLGVGGYDNVSALLIVRYEDFVEHGTESLLRAVEAATGKKARCQPYAPRLGVKKKTEKKNDIANRSEFVEWLNGRVDWDVENLIGYGRR
uniref:Sulfotransferase domain-containing protein n=1 Tax=Trieres chinensis TaxID=1514140 RepID=A0A7S1ZB74_TRICV|mmetsp:Transcript_21699/g.43877  ORF Transcript_21699/g.43877 Transcript_21699/m.43877 type:complete len:346 (+) Transcript_21699:249-1286(+)